MTDDFEYWYRLKGYYHDTVSDRRDLMHEAYKHGYAEGCKNTIEQYEATQIDIKETVEGLISKIPKSTAGDGDYPPRMRIPRLLFMLQEIPKLEREKAMRWIGYIQGIMAMRGLIDVDEERDRTRPIFNRKKGDL